ncbi:MAG TPA: MASE1 domain-containing protein [Dongiaceae bacterium]|nr:MASE1 domain-containing protein [Dongiaceae bacterium]
MIKPWSWPFSAPTPDAIRRGLDLSLRDVAGFVIFEIAFYFAYRSGMAFSQAAASPFWFPDSVLLCALLVSRPQLWWIFVLLPLPVRLFSNVAEGIPLWFLLTTFWIDSAKGVFAAWALRHFVGRTFRLETVREFVAFFAFAVLLIPAVAAFCGATARSALGHSYWMAWEQWFLGNALAQLIVTPAILHWCLRLPLKAKLPDARRRIEAMVLAIGLLVTGYLATNTGSSAIDFAGARFYVPVPLLFWAAFRFGMRGASGATAILAILAVHGAINGRGPFADLSPADITLALQNFLLLRSVPLYVVAAVIAQRREVEARLRESEARFRSMANTAPVLLWISDRDAGCEFVNQRWLDLTGRSQSDVAGKGWLEDVHPDDVQPVLQAYHAAAASRQPFEIEYRLRRHDGEYRWISHNAALRHGPGGEMLGYIGSAIDVTDRKESEQAGRAISHAQRLILMGELSAAIAHEVRQPLHAILNNAAAAANLLAAPNPSLQELREIISDIRADDLRAAEIVSRIREFLRPQATNAQRLDVSEVVSDALLYVGSDARHRQVLVRNELARNLPPVFADRTQLLQVLINLLVNAMDAMEGMPEAERHLTARTGVDATGKVEVAISDSGHGLPPEDMRRIFEPFFTTKPQGMGLGLYIARSIVGRHRGDIRAEGNPTGGSTFRITLPAEPVSPGQ